MIVRQWIMPGIAVLLALCPATGAVSAQTPAPAPAPAAPPGAPAEEPKVDITSDIELTRAAIQVRRQALVTAAMDLEPKESEAFWPVYRAYRTDMAKVNDRYTNLLVTYLENYDTLSDQMATRIMGDYLGIERDRTAIKARYLPRFRKVMPARKVMRFFQVDHKLDALINAELAADVPLAR
jgi:hypothetical protein